MAAMIQIACKKFRGPKYAMISKSLHWSKYTPDHHEQRLTPLAKAEKLISLNPSFAFEDGAVDTWGYLGSSYATESIKDGSGL